MANLLSTAITGTTTTSDSVVIGGTFANNAYNSVSSTRLMFGGGDAPNNYSIGTSLNNYGGNYTKLDLRWHTGIRMGAQPGYGGIRFFSDETLATRIMSIGETDANIRIDNNLYIGGAGGWITDLLAAKQNASTAITTSNIGSQSVTYATTAGSATNSSQLQGYSAYSIVEESRGVHSGSDFPSGTLVQTDINADEWAGNSFVMEVSGKSYGSGTPFKLAMEGYLYADTVINVSAMSYGSYFPGPVKVMRLNGTLAFWWPRGSYWNSFQVHVRNADGESWNRVTGISDSVDPPSADKKVSVTPVQVIHTNNIASQSVSYATTAGALTSMNISQFTNNSGYITSVGNITRLWAESHPTDYYVRANWTGTYWQLTSNHPSPVQVGYADSAGSAGSLTSMNISQFTNNSGYITGYTETDTLASVTGRGATTASQVSFTKTDDHAISVGTIRGRVVNSQGGEFIQLYERVNIGGPNGWGAANTAAPSYGLSVYGGATIGYGNSGGLAVTGTLSATNFSGSSSGTNTGDQTNISGNAATATYATSAGNADTVDSLHASSFVRNDTTRQYLKPYFEYSEWLTTQSPLDLVNQMGGGGFRVDFLHPSYTANGNWGHVITWSGYNGYTMYQMSGSYGSGADVELYVRNEANHQRNAWSSWRRLLHDNNYNSYAPTLTGTGASGTWGISITGNANTATTATTASNLAADTSTRFKVITFTGEGGDSGNGNSGSNYGIYQQGGSWTHPYPDLCIGFHTGIKIGAQSQYNGIRFYNTETWGTEIFSVGNGDNHVRVLNNLYVTGTVTGSNLSGTNTGDQTNISGNAATATYATSAGSAGTAGSAGSVDGLTINNSGAPINPDNVTQNQIGYNTSVSLFGQTDGGLYSSAYSSSWIHQIYGDFRSGQIAIRGKNSGTWGDWRLVVDDKNIGTYAVPYGNMTSSTGLNDNKLYLRTNGDNNHYLWNAADDWEELVYYNGTGFRVKGATGTVSATFTDSGISIGTSSTLIRSFDAQGYLRIYGSSTNYLGIGPYNNNGWVYFENSGNSTGIYFNSPGRYAFDSVDVTPYNDNENSLGSGSYRWANIYTGGWLRNYGAQGMYNESYGTHFYSNSAEGFVVTGSGGVVQLQFRSNHQSTLRGYVYADTSNNIGFLNNGGDWSLRTDSSRNSFIYGTDLTINAAGAASSNIIMNDGDEGSRIIHCNSNRIGFLNQASSWGSYCNDNGSWESDVAMYAPIFYDSADTGYYLDPNATSNLNNVNAINFRPSNAIYFGGGNNYFNWTNSRIYSNVGIESASAIYSPQFRLTNSANNAYITGNSEWGMRMVNDNGYIQFGPANGSWSHIYSDKSFYFNQELYVNGTQVVKNSGTWGISVTGSAASSGRSSSLDIVGYGDGNMTYYQSSGTFAGYSGWAGYFVSNHGNGSNYYNQTIITPFWSPPQYSRLQGGTFVGPYTFWSTENLNDYAPNMNQYVRTTDNVTFNTTTSPTILVNGHSDNTKGYRIHNTSGSSVSAMFTNSSNQLVIAAGAVDQINLNKKVYVNAVALGVNVAPSATAGRIDASNDIVAFSSSDERLKDNITPIENALDKVKSLTGVEFDWKPEHKGAHGHEGHDTGIIAQQVLGVMPSAVRTNDTGYLAVRYEKLIGLLIEGMKEQQTQIDELKTKLDGLTK